MPDPAAREAHLASPVADADDPSSAATVVHAGRNDERVFLVCAAALGAQCVVQSAAVSSTANGLAHKPLWLGAIALLVAAALFIRGRRAVRATLALLLGVLGSALGVVTSISHAALAGPAAADYTGTVATVTGLVLIGLGFRLALTGRHWAAKLVLGALLAFAVLEWGLIPAINAGVASNARHPEMPSAASLGVPGARDVSFAGADGTRLSGWYLPGRSGAAVIVLHGSHDTRRDTVGHLHMLSAAGFGVLAFDARGHGSSGGRANALGWQGSQDVKAAVRFVQAQRGVDRGKIAALGLSMGAEEALRAAASGVPLSAVVADGAGASTQGDDEIVSHGPGPLYASVNWLTLREVELASGAEEPAPLKSIVDRVHVPVLLIASNAPNERVIDAAYAARMGTNATLWYIATAQHTKGLQTVRRAYTARVIAFLDAAFGRSGH